MQNLTHDVPIRITELCFGGSRVERLPPDGLTLILGSNNVGKSAALQDIASFLGSPQGDIHNAVSVLSGITLTGDEFPDDHSPHLGRLYDTFTDYQRIDERLGLIREISLDDNSAEARWSPLRHMYFSPEFEDLISRLTLEAFGQPVCVNHHISSCELRLGALQPVSSEGDGVRSFIGLLLHALVPNRPLKLIDEPEAFLDPSLSRLMGRMLDAERPIGSQMIIATHSPSFVQGVLEVPTESVKLIRLSRTASGLISNRSLDPKLVATFWRDSRLRYSELFLSLFKKGVIICGSDVERQFYTAAFDHQLPRESCQFLVTHVGVPH
ncbi:MAG: ATP-dependent nuclease, partial [Streptosporangiaceae bacterium]